MAKILVLGAGMVGSAMVRDVAQRHEVVATDFSAAALEALAGVDRVSTQTLDCTDRAAVQAAAREVDAVICAVPGHLGPMPRMRLRGARGHDGSNKNGKSHEVSPLSKRHVPARSKRRQLTT